MRLSRSAVAVLFLVPLMMAVAAYFAAVNYYNAGQPSQKRQAAAEAAAQKRQAQMIERKICTGFGRVAALRPPADNPAANPSRAFDQQEHAILVDIGADAGCGGKS